MAERQHSAEAKRRRWPFTKRWLTVPLWLAAIFYVWYFQILPAKREPPAISGQPLRELPPEQAWLYYAERLQETNSPVALYYLGRCYYHLRDYEKAELVFQRIAMSPYKVPEDVHISSLYWLGHMAMARGNYQEAEQHLDLALNYVQPEQAPPDYVQLARAKLLIETEQFAEAKTVLDGLAHLARQQSAVSGYWWHLNYYLTFWHREDFAACLRYAVEAQARYAAVGDTLRANEIDSDIALFHLVLGKAASGVALSSLDRSYLYFEGNGHQREIAAATGTLWLYAKCGQLPERYDLNRIEADFQHYLAWAESVGDVQLLKAMNWLKTFDCNRLTPQP